jgi:antitoxin component YwqK of YwqJK toxin-antitoxin module
VVSLLFFACKQNDNKIAPSAISNINLEQVDKSQLTLDQSKGLVYHLDKPFTGYSISTYPNDVKSEEIAYANGKLHGSYKKWFEEGLLSYECTYNQGLQVDQGHSWWRNGNMRSEANYKNGKVHGVQTQWYKSGSIFKKMTFNMGREDGMQQSWRENGKIYNNYEAKNGRIFGLKRAALCFQLEDEEVVFSTD